VDLEAVRTRVFASVSQSYVQRDSMLYALGLGYGANPTDPAELQFTYEKGLKTVPSMCVVLGYPGFWMAEPKYGIDWVKALHAEHYFEIHKPIPPEGALRAEHALPAVEDKGDGKGALLYIEKRLFDESDELVAMIRQTMFLRGDGGYGGYGSPPPPPEALPDRAADKVTDIALLPQQALIYRLSGDYNPIHADPELAAKAGFSQPILHGLCTMGLATKALLAEFGGADPAKLKSLYVRFSKPVFPGETVRFEFYDEGQQVRFRARAVERDVVVLDRCRAELR